MKEVLPVILAAAAAPRCRVVDRRRWAVGTRGWGGDRERGLQGISATSWIRMSQAPFSARDSGPFYCPPPWKSRNVVVLGASPANQCLERAPKKLLVALCPDADDIDEKVSPGHGVDEAGWREPAEMRPGKWLHRKGRGNGHGIKVVQAALASMRSSGIDRSESSFGV